MRTKTAVLLLLAAIPLAAANQPHELAPNESKWVGQIRAGGELNVRSGLGDVDIVASDADQVVVEVKRGSEGSVIPRIVVVEADKGLFVCGDWTTRAGEPSSCGSGKLLASGALKNYARADFRIAVPVGTSVNAQTNTGNVSVAPLKASVAAQTYEGKVLGTADGPKFIADNLRGDIEIHVSPEPMKQKVKASTMGATVRIVLPETRTMHYEFYTRGAPLYTTYLLEGGPQPQQRGETKEERIYREITKNNWSGSLGPKSKLWLYLEVYVQHDGKIELDKP